MLSILIRPLVVFVLFLVAAVIGRWVLRQIPEGRLKRVLIHRFPVIPQNEAERQDWWPVIVLFALGIVFWGIILYADH
jgi:RsiW-degrading membrane proteinase PrsW (M82 family)